VAAKLLGEHDFATFGAPTQGKTTLRTVLQSEWTVTEPGECTLRACRGESTRLLMYRIEANGFLQRMVRTLVGEMVDIGLGKRTLAEFREAFQAADRRRARAMAPPHGLTLMEVTYGTENER